MFNREFDIQLQPLPTPSLKVHQCRLENRMTEPRLSAETHKRIEDLGFDQIGVDGSVHVQDQPADDSDTKPTITPTDPNILSRNDQEVAGIDVFDPLSNLDAVPCALGASQPPGSRNNPVILDEDDHDLNTPNVGSHMPQLPATALRQKDQTNPIDSLNLQPEHTDLVKFRPSHDARKADNDESQGSGQPAHWTTMQPPGMTTLFVLVPPHFFHQFVSQPLAQSQVFPTASKLGETGKTRQQSGEGLFLA
ncbi:hypothetical protein ACJQWK_08741 [Exserohilum turcicum]